MANLQLHSFHIIEQSSVKENIILWTFPTLSNNHRSVLTRKVFNNNLQCGFYYLRFQEWFYLYEYKGEKPTAICFISTEFNPNKYRILCDAFLKKYGKTKDCVELVKLYLMVFMQNSTTVQENGALVTYNLKESTSTTNIKEMVQVFQLEIILIYIALLLKRRILMYHSNLEVLQKALHCATKLMMHRSPNEYVFPIIEDIPDVRVKSFMLTGTLNNRFQNSSELYDIYIDLISEQITISPNAKETFIMTKLHKDLAMFIVQQAKDADLSETDFVAELNDKTQEILTNLKSLATVTSKENKLMLTLDVLRAKKYNLATENFLFNLAIAENMMML